MPVTRCSLLLALLLASCGDAGGTGTETGPGTGDATSGPATTTGGAATEPTPTTGPGSSSGPGPGSSSDGGESTSPTTGGAETGGDAVAGLELLPRLAGLWSGPVTMTPLGTFALMNVDMRAASGEVMFGRVDLDAMNSLRFAFEIEAPGGEATLVYRNGGYFLGLLRDSRTRLIEHDVDAGTWRFCSTSAMGCDYIDARWTFKNSDALIFDVKVKGMQHVYWDAKRKATQALPEPFPADMTPQADDAPFPPMPTLKIDVDWTEPMPQDGAVWVILSTMPCDFQFNCTHSRSLMQGVPAGATAASLTIEQIHAGPYKLNVVLDRNNNLPSTLAPDKGDGIGGVNQAVVVEATGETAVKTSIFVTL